MTESEIKLRVAGPEAAREALRRLGATLVQPRHFEDNALFDDARGSLRAAGRLLRLRRRTPGEAILTFKRARAVVEGVKTRDEIEASVSDAEAVRDILQAVGLTPTFQYQKYRESYAWRDVEIVVDETPVGTFLEVEGDLDGIHAAAAALGFGAADYITDSYAGLFFAAGGQGDMVFK